MSSKDNVEWIRHRGGKCPVEDGTLVDVKCRDGSVHEGLPAHWWLWHHKKDDDDIMAWKLHKAERQIDPAVVANVDAFNAQAEMHAAKKDGPLQWRDRIHTIDAEQKAADEAHKAATEARDAERAELVAKLRAEGLALIQAENMSDPANWQVDDIVEIIGSTNDGWLRYKGMKGQLKYDGDWFVNFGLANEWYLSDNTDIKWHSRPAK